MTMGRGDSKKWQKEQKTIEGGVTVGEEGRKSNRSDENRPYHFS